MTVLVYLNDVAQGGATSFPNLNLQIQPKQGMALVFFPATLDGLLDRRALHAGTYYTTMRNKSIATPSTVLM